MFQSMQHSPASSESFENASINRDASLEIIAEKLIQDFGAADLIKVFDALFQSKIINAPISISAEALTKENLAPFLAPQHNGGESYVHVMNIEKGHSVLLWVVEIEDPKKIDVTVYHGIGSATGGGARYTLERVGDEFKIMSEVPVN